MWIRLMGWLSAFWCSNDLITGLQIMLVTVFGAVFCVKGMITVGEYIAFASYNGMLCWPVRELGRVISDMSKAGISVDRICYIMNSEREDVSEDPVIPLPEELGDIVFDHVSFAYEEGNDVVKDISFTIRKGSTLGILGGTGSGKSTLMYLLDRLYDLPEGCGRITIGGKDIKEYDRKDLRRQIGLVPQEPFSCSRQLFASGGLTAVSRLSALIPKESALMGWIPKYGLSATIRFSAAHGRLLEMRFCHILKKSQKARLPLGMLNQ